MFWVDETINEILNRADEKYLVTDYKTPSGKIHIGALRGVIIHDVISRGLIEKSKQAEFWYGFDDFDPIDGLSDDLKNDYGKFMGMPLCNVQSPDKDKNFAQYYAKSFIDVINLLGINVKIIWASEIYKNGTHNKAIEIVLNNADKIRQIYKDVSGGEKPNDWYPLHVVCPKCGKIGTTKVTGWDGKEVEFECLENLVQWAKGCGEIGKMSPFDGNAKMPYKVETAAKWFAFNTSVELAGKDHYTKGGTFYVARAVADQVFKIKPAYGYGYEWFLVGGKKMSTSRGTGASVEEIAAILRPEILRFLMVRTRAKRSIEFDVEGDTISLLYDEYDRCSAAYLEDPDSDLGRAYYYSEIDPTKKPAEYLMRFSKVAFFLQMPHVDILSEAEKEKGAPLSSSEKQEIQNRTQEATLWLKKYAPEEAKFSICEKLPDSVKEFTNEQKVYLEAVLKKLKELDNWDGKAIHTVLHEVKNEQKLPPKDAFSAIYRIFIDKDSGPQAGWFLAALDKKFVINRLEEV
ncbi:MAG: lysine--tRNA ligase [bacterium]|nr:lysine--tRNA ligase [bacterium]